MKKGTKSYPWNDVLIALLKKTPPEFDDYKILDSVELAGEIKNFKEKVRAKI